MKPRIILSCFFVVTISFSSFGFILPVPVRKSNLNRDLVIANLINGINSGNQGLRMSSA